MFEVDKFGSVWAYFARQNLLLDGKSQTLKICDFGTAKRMIYGEQCSPHQFLCFELDTFAFRQRPYMVSRYYRAPELILGVQGSRLSLSLGPARSGRLRLERPPASQQLWISGLPAVPPPWINLTMSNHHADEQGLRRTDIGPAIVHWQRWHRSIGARPQPPLRSQR